MFTQQLRLTIILTLALTSLTSYPTSALTQLSLLVSQNPPPAPKTPPPPPGRREPGGSLGGSNSSCKSTNKQLTALVPVDSQGLTTLEHPTFWFYIPDAPEDIRSAEFSLLTQDGKKWVYRTSFRLPATPGVISISLSKVPESALEQDKFYHWYLKLYCATSTREDPDLVVDGWVQRVSKSPEDQNSTEIPKIWYDSVTDLANRRLASPQDEKLKSEWTKLLKSVGLEGLAQEPLVGSVLRPENQ